MDIDKKLEEKQEELDQTITAVNVAKTDLNVLETKAAKKEEELDYLDKDVDATQEQLENKREELSAVQDDITVADGRLRELEVEISDIENEIAKTIETKESTIKNAISDSEDKLSKLAKDLNETEERLLELNKERNEIVAEIITLRNDLRTEEIKHKQRMVETNEIRTNTENNIKEVIDELEQKKEQLGITEYDLEAARSELTGIRNSRQEAIDANEAAKAELIETQGKVSAAKSELEITRAENKKERDQLLARRKHAKYVQEKEQHLRDKYEELGMEYHEYKAN